MLRLYSEVHMTIEDALETINQAQRDNLSGSGDLDELKRGVENEEFLSEICRQSGLNREEVMLVIEVGLSRTRRSEAEWRSGRIPRRFRR